LRFDVEAMEKERASSVRGLLREGLLDVPAAAESGVTGSLIAREAAEAKTAKEMEGDECESARR
jgi:hypothetical protein